MNLQLSLKKKWFDMTKSGEKPEDYREITPYWCKRLMKNEYNDDWCSFDELFDLNNRRDVIEVLIEFHEFKNFKTNTMTLGYPKKGDISRILLLEHEGVEIGTGNPDWGAEPNKIYFIIKHGSKILDNDNLFKEGDYRCKCGLLKIDCDQWVDCKNKK